MQAAFDEIKNIAKLIWLDPEPDVVARRLPGENPAYPPFIVNLLVNGRVKRVASGRSEDEAVATLRAILEEDYQLHHWGEQLKLIAEAIRSLNLNLVSVAGINATKRWQEVLGPEHPRTFDEKLVAAAFFEANGGSVLKL